MTRPGTYRVATEQAVEWPDAVDAWADAARPVLERLARKYGSMITYGDLAEEIQTTTGIRTSMLLPNWIGQVLGRVVHSQPADEPALTSLVIDASGYTGKGYAEVIRRRHGAEVHTLEDHAANERLRCHVYFGATNIPPSGGRPIYAPSGRKPQTAQRSKAAAAPQTPPPAVCPTCFVQLPQSGECDSCG